MNNYSLSFLAVMLLCCNLASAFYNQQWGRFLNRDPLQEEGGENLYRFVSNDPVNRWDLLGLYQYQMKEPREVEVRKGYNQFTEVHGRFNPGKPSVAPARTKNKSDSGNSTYSIEIRISHEKATIGTPDDARPGAREHEETHQSITKSSYEAIAPDVSPFEGVSFETPEEAAEAATSDEGKAVLTAAAKYAGALSNYNNLKFDLENDDEGDDHHVDQDDVDDAEEEMNEAKNFLNSTIGSFLEKHGSNKNSDDDSNETEENDSDDEED